MIIKKNSPIPIDETTDLIIRADPSDGGNMTTPYFIVEMQHFTTPEKLNYKITSHCLSIPELRKMLGLKKKEVLSIL